MEKEKIIQYLNGYKKEMVNIYICNDLIRLYEELDNTEPVNPKCKALTKKYKKELLAEIEASTKHAEEIKKAIEALANKTYRTLLYMRYIKSETWATIADSIGYAESYTHRIHKEALNALAPAVVH